MDTGLGVISLQNVELRGTVTPKSLSFPIVFRKLSKGFKDNHLGDGMIVNPQEIQNIRRMNFFRVFHVLANKIPPIKSSYKSLVRCPDDLSDF